METGGPVLSNRLSGIDAAFLYLERKEIPLHIGAVCVFEGAIPFEEFVASVASKLHRLPRYRQVVAMPPFNADYPAWEDDPEFDIRQHIFPAHLSAPGGEAELEALAGQILSEVMDRSKPLWDIHVVDGLEQGRGALIARVHHSLADGVAGASLLKLMLDATPEGSRPISPAPPEPRRARGWQRSLEEAAASGLLTSLQHVVRAEEGVLRFVQALSDEKARAGLEGVAALLPELGAAVERLPFNRPCTGARKVCWAEFDFSDVQAIRAAAGGTVNDIVLTVLTRAIARYLALHGETIQKRLLRVICPVSLRSDGGASLGNRISFLPVVVPMDIASPVHMLDAVAARTRTMKASGTAELIAILANCLGAVPPPLQAMLWRAIPYVTFPLPLFHLICTNVAGPPAPLYAVGRRMVAAYPHVPTGYELGIGCAVQSYAARLCFGLTADTNAAPDVVRLREFLKLAFEELCVAAGVRKRATRRRKRPGRERVPG